MKDEIIEYLKNDKNKQRCAKEIAQALGYGETKDFISLMKELNNLEDSGEIIRDDFNRYYMINQKDYYKGVLSVNKKGFGFVKTDDTEFYVSKTDMKNAYDGDIVLLKKKTKDPQNDEGIIINVLERGKNTCVGLVKEVKGKYHVFPDDHTRPDIFIEKRDLHGAAVGHKVLAEIKDYEPKVRGTVIKIIGHKNDPGVDILSVVHEHGAHIDFPDNVYKQIENIGDTIDLQGMKGRTDLRDLLTVTIDGETAKDLDDAVSLRVLNNHHYELGVHIADVSYYVTEGSPLDDEAIERGTSIYLVDRVIPMLPHKLSNGICSLNEGADRYTISCFMEIDQQGKVVDHKILPTVINSNHRMTYTNVNKILAGDKKVRKEYDDSIELFETMKELSDILTKKRNIRGAIDFDTQEAEIIVDNKGKPLDVVLRERGESERIIESFMLAANETVAEHFKWMDLPFIYRIHETPKTKKLQQFLAIAKPLGYTIHGSLDHIRPKELSKIINKSKGRPEHPIISTLLLRSMQKARYDRECLGHFGLADDFYTHFTSPIRRYPDLLVHRLIRTYLFNEQYNKINHFEEVIPDLAERSSECERKAIDIEREVEDMKKAEYMSYHIGEKFKGVISSVTHFGFFVELENTIEGLVHITDLTDDYYAFNEERLILVGERTKKIYKLSDPITVIVKGANKVEKQIDFLDAASTGKSFRKFSKKTNSYKRSKRHRKRA